MRIFVAKETTEGETRIPLTPNVAKKLCALEGAEVEIEAGLGEALGLDDEAFKEAGCEVSEDTDGSLEEADIVLRLHKPPIEQVEKMKKGAILISYLNPFFEFDYIRELSETEASTISMEMMPRTTLAQKMDAISSQANLAGYVAVVLAAERMDKILPMMMTPAGTLSPSKVFIIGVGVAGLQAIATAKRMGARVEAFDTRPVVEEQVKSLGAKFVKVDLGETGETDQGYAKELTEEQQEKQREAMAKVCAQSDVVITTAQLFGRKAPTIVTEKIIKTMKPGSIIVDLAVETGGNVEGSKLGEVVEVDGVTIIGLGNFPGRVALSASEMYASNLYNFVSHFWDKEEKSFQLNRDDEIIKGTLMTHEGEVVNQNPMIQNLLEKKD